MDTYFSVLFRTTRTRLGYSLYDFADLLRIEVEELKMIESSEEIPSSEMLYRFETLSGN